MDSLDSRPFLIFYKKNTEMHTKQISYRPEHNGEVHNQFFH